MNKKWLVSVLALPLLSCEHQAQAMVQPSEDELEYQSHRLDVLAEVREDSQAWEFYSQRCKDQIGSLKRYSRMLDEFFGGRHPIYTRTFAHSNGDFGEVMSVDRDPGAPNWVMMPRKWTFIGGQWKFDNC